MITTNEILLRAKAVSQNAPLSCEVKNKALKAMADALLRNSDEILKANALDISKAKETVSQVMLDRLRLTTDRIEGMAKGILEVADLPDPVGRVVQSSVHKNGLLIEKTSVPFGVVAIIYESRPNVTSDAAALSFKSGNVCVLRGGKEAYSSAYAIVKALKEGLRECGIDENYINLVEDTTRQSANELMTAVGLVDLLIPRGGKGLIKACTDNAKVPCIETGTGICHIYVDKEADLEKALKIIDNAKTSRPSVCNAAEVCLVHKSIAPLFLPKLYDSFYSSDRENKVELMGDSEVLKYINVTPAGENDFDTEFLDYKMAVKIVNSAEEAVAHIAEHSTHHSESIITEDGSTADYFTARVDSAAVYVNASTRFTDGGEFGLGCEMGISTQKLHARGPMGLNELNTYKYIIKGNGQIR
ncbi:MAG: glutamate-5-semialdehyde dehydrogenase [Ruminococcaceae bacterium]|nr:glutamate-5-semialdehyde dehydrogenase [Oscillospiraceae bacterium]